LPKVHTGPLIADLDLFGLIFLNLRVLPKIRYECCLGTAMFLGLH